MTKLLHFITSHYSKITDFIRFEEKYREFLRAHEEFYFVTDFGRLCFHEEAKLDVIGIFGGDGWIPEQGGFIKEWDGVTIKLMSSYHAAKPVSLSPKPQLDVVASDGCKISLPSVPAYGLN